MRKYIIGIAIGVLLTSAAVVLAGSLDSPGLPGATNSYNLEDIYNRLNTGTAGAQNTWTEPATGPGSTGHTLNEVMAKAPKVDNTHGATETQVLTGTTVWGLTSDAWGVITGTLECGGGAGVPKTGQKTCWDTSGTSVNCSGTGQDGEFQKGVEWPDPRFTDNSDGTVTDNLTGLIWLKDAACDGYKTWANALTWANGLFDGCGSCGGTNNDCGLSDGSSAGDWRLPNVRELYSLTYYTTPSDSATWLGNQGFSNVQQAFYWSSTTHAEWKTEALCMDLGNDNNNYRSKTTTMDVWPVRDGQ